MELVELLGELVAIDSVNPDLVPGGVGETELAAYVARWCDRAGLAVELYEPAPGRPNVIAVARGLGGGRSLLLNAHLDTVGVAGMVRPHEPRIEGGRLYGRGAYDMKAGLAAIMVAAADSARAGLRGDVILTAVADEEFRSVGTESIAGRLRADAAIVTEPTELRLCLAHKGFVALEVESLGRAAHGSRPDLGVDAIAKMGGVLVGLQELDRRLRAGPTHALLGSGSVHASLIEGGQEFSSYPERCSLAAERRTVPGETDAQVLAELQAILDEAATADPQFLGAARIVFSRPSLEVSGEEPIVSVLRRAAGEPEVIGAPYWTDAALLGAAGIPTVIYGPGGEGAHAAVEWADLDQLERCAGVLLATATEWCA